MSSVNCVVSALTRDLIARKLCHGTAQDSRKVYFIVLASIMQSLVE